MEKIQHAIGVAMTAHARIHRLGKMAATANYTDGSAVEDGTKFKLTITWSGSTVHRKAVTKDGKLAFKLRLPASAVGAKATFKVTRGATTTTRPAKSPGQRIRIIA